MGMERIREIDAAASEWLIRRDAGAWSPADQARLDEWLNASTLNRVAFLRLELAWEDAARLKALGAGILGDKPPPAGRWNLTPFFDAHPAAIAPEDPETLLKEEGSAFAAAEVSAHRTTPDETRPSDGAAWAELDGNPLIAGVCDVNTADGQPVHRGAHPVLASRTDSRVPPSGALVVAASAAETAAADRGDVPTPSIDSRSMFAADESLGIPNSGRPRLTSSASHRRGRFLAAAAILLLSVSVAASYLFLFPHGDRYTTPVGGLSSVPMADGSLVTLNTDSQIRVALTETERRVELRRGEAFFEVSKDPHRPFVVRAGTKRVIAVGTQFSVRRDGEDIEVIVTEGKVRVQDSAPRPGSRQDGSADVFLTAGSIARAGEAGVLVLRKTLPEAEEQLSWRTGVLLFRNQNLADAIAEFNRYNVRKIVIRDPTVAALKIEGNFRATNVEAFVRLLESGFPVRAQDEADRIVLVAK
jgi:transmembrane sensor